MMAMLCRMSRSVMAQLFWEAGNRERKKELDDGVPRSDSQPQLSCFGTCSIDCLCRLIYAMQYSTLYPLRSSAIGSSRPTGNTAIDSLVNIPHTFLKPSNTFGRG